MIHDKKIGLALSGGGYRAAAYHIGTLRALRKMGILDKVDVVSSISGGSITAAYYALHKDNYEEFEKSLISKLSTGVLWATIIIALLEGAGLLVLHGWLLSILLEVDICSCWKVTAAIVLSALFLLLILLLLHKIVPTSCLIEKLYQRKFFGKKKLSDLPDKPIFAINATSVEDNQHLTFSQLKVACGWTYKDGYFKGGEIPISLAVMASSAYPMFAPVTIPSGYLTNEKSKSPILVDGGIYDNHGTHKLSEDRSAYHADYVIVSEAGNTPMNRKKTWNIVSLLRKVIDMMMNRIEKLQRRYNEYRTDNSDHRYAYVALTWFANQDYLSRFVGNIKEGHVADSLCRWHGMDEDLVERVKAGDKEAATQAQKIVEKSIGWDALYAKQPNKDIYKTAICVGTSLCGLSLDKMSALIAVSEWLAEVQVKTYMPMIMNK